MPKKRPEPYWRSQTKCYYVQIRGRQHRLSPDEDDAFRLYHELMARPPESPVPAGPGTAVVAILDDSWNGRGSTATPRPSSGTATDSRSSPGRSLRR